MDDKAHISIHKSESGDDGGGIPEIWVALSYGRLDDMPGLLLLHTNVHAHTETQTHTHTSRGVHHIVSNLYLWCARDTHAAIVCLGILSHRVLWLDDRDVARMAVVLFNLKAV